MVDTVDDFEQVFLTYKDVREANPGWTDRMIEDYLSLKRDVANSTEVADTSVDSVQGSNVGAISLDRLENDHLYETQSDITGRLALNAIGELAFEVVSTDSNFTTTGNQIIICNNTSSIEVTLNSFPEDGERVYIKRRNNIVKVIGLVDGKQDRSIVTKYDCPLLVYTDAAGEWSII